MKSHQILKKSCSHLHKFRNMIFLLYIIELIVAIILVIPLQNQFEKMIGHSLLSRELLQGFETTVFIEWANHWARAAHTQFSFTLLIGFIYLILCIFLEGGVLGTIIREEEVNFLNQFFGNAGHYFGRFFRLFILMIPFVLLAFGIFFFLGAFFNWISDDNEGLRFLLVILQFLITLFLLLFVKMVSDYAKIQTVFRERIRMLKTICGCFIFVWRNLGKTLSLFYMVGAIGFLLLVVQIAVGKIINPTTIGLILLFIWQQVYMVARMVLKILLFISQSDLYQKYVEPDYENILSC